MDEKSERREGNGTRQWAWTSLPFGRDLGRTGTGATKTTGQDEPYPVRSADDDGDGGTDDAGKG